MAGRAATRLGRARGGDAARGDARGREARRSNGVGGVKAGPGDMVQGRGKEGERGGGRGGTWRGVEVGGWGWRLVQEGQRDVGVRIRMARSGLVFQARFERHALLALLKTRC